MLYEINKNVEKYGDKIKQLDKIPVYVDSPLAVSATEIFRQNPECFDDETLQFLMSGSNPLDFKNLHFVKTAEESKALNDDKEPKIIISASGMCEVGRIKHHLKHNLWRPECTILFVGYQAEGTLGRKILNGEKIVKIYGEEIGINAEIRYLDSFSGHADKDGLINFISDMDKKPTSIFIVHGEHEGQKIFKENIEEKFAISANIPARNESYEIIDGKISYVDIGKQFEYKSKRLEVLEILSYLKDDIDELSNIVKKEIKHNVDEMELINLREKLGEIKDIITNTKNQNMRNVETLEK